MKCYNHPKTEAIGVCKTCGKCICKGCTVEQDNKIFCTACSTIRANVAGAKYNPLGAAGLNLFFPGLGFFYMKEWGVGLLFIIVVIVASFFGWVGVIIAYFFMMLECYNTAKTLNTKQLINTSVSKNAEHESASIEKKEKEVVKEEPKPVEAEVPKVKKPEDVPKPTTSGLSHLSPASIFYGVMMLLFALVSLSIILLMVFNFFANNQYGSFGQAVLGNVLCCLPVLFLSGVLGTVFGVMFQQSLKKQSNKE